MPNRWVRVKPRSGTLSIRQQALQQAAPQGGLAVEIERGEEVPIRSDQVALDTVIIGVVAVLAGAPCVRGAEQRGDGRNLFGTAGQRRNTGIEGAHIRSQVFGRIPQMVDGDEQHLEASRLL